MLMRTMSRPTSESPNSLIRSTIKFVLKESRYKQSFNSHLLHLRPPYKTVLRFLSFQFKYQRKLEKVVVVKALVHTTDTTSVIHVHSLSDGH